MKLKSSTGELITVPDGMEEAAFEAQANNKLAEFADSLIKREEARKEAKKGGLIKRKDGSYSRRGLWDNIRANRGSGRKPTKEMLRQEKKIRAKQAAGGTVFKGYVTEQPMGDAVPWHSSTIGRKMGPGGPILQYGKNFSEFTPYTEENLEGIFSLGYPSSGSDKEDLPLDMVTPAVRAQGLYENTDPNKLGYETLVDRLFINPLKSGDAYDQLMDTGMSNEELRDAARYKKETYGLRSPQRFKHGKGGYTVKRSSARKGKTHVVIGPDGTKKYFGDSKLGQHPKNAKRKKAFYARHAKNLKGNPYFRAFARATWNDGGQLNSNYPIRSSMTQMSSQQNGNFNNFAEAYTATPDMMSYQRQSGPAFTGFYGTPERSEIQSRGPAGEYVRVLNPSNPEDYLMNQALTNRVDVRAGKKLGGNLSQNMYDQGIMPYDFGGPVHMTPSIYGGVPSHSTAYRMAAGGFTLNPAVYGPKGNINPYTGMINGPDTPAYNERYHMGPGGFLGGLKDFGLMQADQVTSIVNPDIIKSSSYSDTGFGKAMKGYSEVTGQAINKLAPMAATAIGGPAAGFGMSALQGASKQFVKPDEVAMQSTTGKIGSALGQAAGIGGMFYNPFGGASNAVSGATNAAGSGNMNPMQMMQMMQMMQGAGNAFGVHSKDGGYVKMANGGVNLSSQPVVGAFGNTPKYSQTIASTEVLGNLRKSSEDARDYIGESVPDYENAEYIPAIVGYNPETFTDPKIQDYFYRLYPVKDVYEAPTEYDSKGNPVIYKNYFIDHKTGKRQDGFGYMYSPHRFVGRYNNFVGSEKATREKCPECFDEAVKEAPKQNRYLMPDGKYYNYEDLLKTYPSMKFPKVFENAFRKKPPTKMADGGQSGLVPINVEGADFSEGSGPDARKGELLVLNGRIIKNYVGRPPHPAEGQNPLGNDDAPEGLIVIPKARTKEYLEAGLTKRQQIERSLVSQQQDREMKKSRKMGDGGYYSFGMGEMGMGEGGDINTPNGNPENIESMMGYGYKKGGWIQKVTKSIKRRGTEGVCTGSKFGSSSCPPGSRRYNLAKTFRKMAKARKHEHGGFVDPVTGSHTVMYNYGGNTGASTDSTSIYNAQARNLYNQAMDLLSRGKVQQADATVEKYKEAKQNAERQFFKGVPGFDRFGNPIMPIPINRGATKKEGGPTTHYFPNMGIEYMYGGRAMAKNGMVTGAPYADTYSGPTMGEDLGWSTPPESVSEIPGIKFTPPKVEYTPNSEQEAFEMAELQALEGDSMKVHTSPYREPSPVSPFDYDTVERRFQRQLKRNATQSDWANIASDAMRAAPIVANLIGAVSKRQYLKPEEFMQKELPFRATRFDETPYREATSRGLYNANMGIAGRTALASQMAGARSQGYQGYRNQEALRRSQLDAVNAQIESSNIGRRLQISDINRRIRSAGQAAGTAAATAAGQIGAENEYLRVLAGEKPRKMFTGWRKPNV